MYLFAVTRETVQLMHPDRIGNGPQIQGSQVLDAMHKKPILLTYDLGRHFQDGLGALIERTNKPRRSLQTVGEIGLVLGIFRGPRDIRMIALVDKNLG